MRRRRMIVGAVIGAVIGAVVIIAVAGTGDSSAPDPRRGAAALGTATVSAGEVEVEITPTFDGASAVFRVVLDTHSVDLDVDLAKTADLSVAGVEWPVAGWAGDGPGGHHRQGDLTFTAAGQPSGEVILTIGGLPEAVDARWSLGP